MNGPLPQEIDIDGVPWKVVEEYLVGDHGECRVESCTIAVESRLGEPIKWITFIHELCHAIAATRGFDTAFGDGKTYTEEEIASLWGAGFFTILARNATVTWRH